MYLFPLKHIVSHLYENLTLLGPSFDLALFGRPDIQHIRYPPKMHLKEAFLWHYCRKVLYGHRLAPPSIGHCDTLPFVQIALYSNWSNSYYQKLQKKRDENLGNGVLQTCRPIEEVNSLLCWIAWICFSMGLSANMMYQSQVQGWSMGGGRFWSLFNQEFEKNVNFIFNQYLEKYCKTLK